jgi:hypothetical protein
VIDGVGMQGWVEVEADEWKHIAVGNERLFKPHGGKIRPSKKMQSVMDEFAATHTGGVILYVTVEDEVKCLMALSGPYLPSPRPSLLELTRRHR